MDITDTDTDIVSGPDRRSHGSGGAQLAERTYDLHGQALFCLARSLLNDAEVAAGVVVKVMGTGAGGAVTGRAIDGARRQLARSMYDSCHPLRSRTEPTTRTQATTMHHLPPNQRAALALVLFGGHDYRDVATTLGLAPQMVACLLTDALRELRA